MKSNDYRPDIDGLRAIAVLLVVGFHIFPHLVPGGFVGVDIFFVISGFLISTIIFTNIDKGAFSFLEFYSRRIRRIFPALAITLAVALVLGWVLLLPEEYKQLGKHVAGGVAFVSNFVLWGESGYFDNAADTKPLLHLWSLGIEEQFYIFFPLVVWAAWKLRLNRLALLLAIFAVSLALNLITVKSDPVAAFYSPQTRFWELMAGAILAHFFLRPMPIGTAKFAVQSICSVAGLALIVVAAAITTSTDAFPGWLAILPVAGAVLLIIGGQGSSINRIFLSNRVMVWFGLISFPLYLWHWVLFTFARIADTEPPSNGTRFAIVGASIVLAWLTYRFVERPIRSGRFIKAKTVGLAALLPALGIAGYAVVANEGYGFRVRDRQEYAAYFENSLPKMQYSEASGVLKFYRNDCNFYDMQNYRIGKATRVPIDRLDASCTAKTPGKRHTLFLWGDSHVQQLYYGLLKQLPPEWDILIVASSGCPASTDEIEDSDTEFCIRSNWYALNAIRKIQPDVVIVGQNKAHDTNLMAKISADLTAAGVGKTIFTGPVPHWTAQLPTIILKKFWHSTPRRTFDGVDMSFLERNNELKRGFQTASGSVFVSLIDFFCNKDGCLTYIGDDRKTGLTTWDYGHLTLVASEFLAKGLLRDVVIGTSDSPGCCVVSANQPK